MKPIIIVGSSRKEGATGKVATQLQELVGADLIHLIDCKIAPYDYEYRNREDDFLPLMEKLLATYDTFIFATPVYWYSMSAQMKTFFDRLSDLLRVEKGLGRKLRGKNMAVLNSSAGDNLGDGFWLPFKASAKYLGMNYLASLHTYEGENAEMELEKFASEISAVSV
ncbi:NAD(P)H-dependent oxidoreductase [Flammeovirgaceae bacterium SG7u.111]|nr:NAD(P)H-dependent oxidoreductase [Flammeovirgaceae bacterium SG7u.132]WPO33216.1 NAD(P)H-dependent oxidoreductase [Flammeovirgaceae bacterium SG7u.111]